MPSRLDRLAELVAQLSGCRLDDARELIGPADAATTDDLEVVARAMVALRRSASEPAIDLRDRPRRPADARERR